MNPTNLIVPTLAVLAVALAACGTQSARGVNASAPTPVVSGGVAGMCARDQPDCVDTPQLASDEPVAIDETGIKQFRRDAKYYLGRSRDELNELVRIARIDDEQFMLTEDYQIGRITVELDDVENNGTPIVTSATVELPDGPETFTLEK